MGTLIIEFLADHPEEVPFLKKLFEIEWEPYYGPDGLGDAESDLITSSKRNKLLLP